MPATGRTGWAVGAAAAALTVGTVLDPWLGGTPWWDYARPGDLWGALLPPLAIWAAVQVVTGLLLRSKETIGRVPVGHVGWVWLSALVVWVPWSLLLHDAFPGSRGSFLGYWLALLGLVLLIWSVVRHVRAPAGARQH